MNAQAETTTISPRRARMDELAQKGRLTPHERALYGWLCEAEKALGHERAQVREWQHLYDRAMTQLRVVNYDLDRWRTLAVALREYRDKKGDMLSGDVLDAIREAEDELGL